jgi:glycosyltransferase involved in cell wall biosynthesis
VDTRRPPDPAAPVLLFLPAHDEQATVASVLSRAPRTVRGHPVRLLVVDDGSTDETAAEAAAAGAAVVRLDPNQGLGAAVRRGLAEGALLGAAAVAFCDADGEYDPAELERLVAPILDGDADYVVGSRFDGDIRRMLPHRRAGNLALTTLFRLAVRAATRREAPRSARPRVRDAQSGYRALSAAAAADAEIIHDYNYAQVLTLDLLAKGYRYREVPISYAFREHGRSFVRLDRYLRRAVPAAIKELSGSRGPG